MASSTAFRRPAVAVAVANIDTQKLRTETRRQLEQAERSNASRVQINVFDHMDVSGPRQP